MPPIKTKSKFENIEQAIFRDIRIIVEYRIVKVTDVRSVFVFTVKAVKNDIEIMSCTGDTLDEVFDRLNKSILNAI